MEDKVSVIIPVYNSEKFLKESIQSVMLQSYENLEIIVVDDGSTDNSVEILNNFDDKITVIHQENQGLAGALNTGIKKMTGKWFKWFSPDDVLFPNAIETLVTESKKLPKNTILYSNWEMIDENGNKIRDFHESNYNNISNFEFNIRLLDGQQININTTLIPSSLFNKGCIVRNLEDISVIDYDFVLRSGILYRMNFHLIEQNLIKYRIHSKQASHKKIIESLTNLNQIKTEILSKLDEKTRKDYHFSLKKYSKGKKLNKKTMELGLKIISKLLPNGISDKMLIFYLNNIRSGR